MKALKTFSIPDLKIVKNRGDFIKADELPGEILKRLQGSKHISKSKRVTKKTPKK